MWPLKDDEEFVDTEQTSLLKGDAEKVKQGKGLKILTPDKLLTRLPILLPQIKLEIIHTN